MLDRGPRKMSAVILGLFGQVAFYADFGRDIVPAWLRVAAHLALVLPLLFFEHPSAVRGGRAPQAAVAIASAVYLGLSLASLWLVLAGVRMPGLGFYLVLESIGAVPAAATAARAARFLRGPRVPPPEPLFQPPWAGAYRTRPTVPPEPSVPAPAPPPRPSRGPVGFALLSTAFAIGGASMAHAPRHAADRFWGLVNLVFFGLGAWVFWEQVAAGALGPELPAPARHRGLVVLFFVGLAATYVGITAEGVPRFDRGVVAGVGALLTVMTAWRAWKTRRT